MTRQSSVFRLRRSSRIQGARDAPSGEKTVRYLPKRWSPGVSPSSIVQERTLCQKRTCRRILATWLAELCAGRKEGKGREKGLMEVSIEGPRRAGGCVPSPNSCQNSHLHFAKTHTPKRSTFLLLPSQSERANTSSACRFKRWRRGSRKGRQLVESHISVVTSPSLPPSLSNSPSPPPHFPDLLPSTTSLQPDRNSSTGFYLVSGSS